MAETLNAEQMDSLASDTGKTLNEAEAAIETLYQTLNFGSDIEPGSELEDAFLALLNVKKLVEVALEIYPFPIDWS